MKSFEKTIIAIGGDSGVGDMMAKVLQEYCLAQIILIIALKVW